MKTLWIAIACLFLPLLHGCSGKKPLPPPQWHFQSGGLTVSLRADPQLNLYEETPHTLVLCLYQLSDPNAFNLFVQNEEGLTDLLACNRFDPSVVNFKRIIVQPGTEQNLVLDRAEGARYAGIVAGYFSLYKDRAAHLFKIPVVIEEKGFFKKTRRKVPGILDIRLYLGAFGMKEMEVKGGS